ncbi:glycosyltransferase [Sulfuricurvum sp.]|uniref:glycosyltransferase n=1 Tax=Sulfuricurvum sp. TaxID=2025608 RepID=UPI00261489DE|nr:glycosyltransferase [Sulfuricurvum sp.]MDD3596690.1 glycosyltransferase [Sulfuricurvum sp.]
MKAKYLILADGNSAHTLKWCNELLKYFDLYLISLNGVSKEMSILLDKHKIFILNDRVDTSGGNYRLILKVPAIQSILKTIRPDYLNAHYISSYGFLAALCKESVDNMRLIVSAWGSDILIEPFSNPLRKWITRYTLQKADYITSDSYHVSDTIQKIHKNQKVLTFAFGFETIENFSGEKELVVFSNRALKRLYNIDTIVHWFSRQDSSWRLVIANDGPERQPLEELVRILGLNEKVTFTGYLSTSEQKEHYQKAAYYISIPSSDATSVSLLEAMQYGAIPIVSNIPANREWILDTINGFYFSIDSQLSTFDITLPFAEINQTILKNKADFPKNIANFVDRIRK